MTGPPTWLSYASPAIAIAALLLSAATYRRAGPRVRAKLAHTPISKEQPGDDFPLKLRLNNSGLAPVEIVGLYFGIDVAVTIRPWQFASEDFYEGPNLPYKLEGGSAQVWILSMKQPLKRLSGSETTFHFSFFQFKPWGFGVVGVDVDLGNGVQVRGRLGLIDQIRLFSQARSLTAK